jgi:hypothetical protein
MGEEVSSRTAKCREITPDYLTPNYVTHSYSTPQRVCSFCNGTGISPIPGTGTCFGIESEHYCEICHKMVPCSHGAHGRCPSCNGKGYY